MLKLRPEHIEALRPVARAQFPERLLRSARKSGEQAERDEATGDLVLTDARGYQSRVSFYPDGLPSQMTRPSGASERYEHDAEGRLAAIEYPGGDRVELERDQRGNIAKIERPGLLDYQLQHDSSDRLVSVAYPDNSEVGLAYDSTGSLAQYTDRAGAKTSYLRTEAGVLEAVIDPLGRETRYVSDEEGRLAAVVFPDGTEEHYLHDAERSEVRITRRDGSQVVQEMDDKGIITAVDWAGERRDFEFQDGRLITAVTGGDQVSAEYDSKGNLVVEATRRGETRFEYDAAGHPVRQSLPTGSTVEYEYDADGRPSVARAWGKEVRITYDPAGQSIEIHFDQCLVETQKFARVGRQGQVVVKNLRGQAISQQTYDYDKNERLTGITDCWGVQLKHQHSRRLEYDAESRLLKEINPVSRNPLVEYAYDSKGNLVSVGGQSIAVGHLDEPVSLGSSKIVYDALGNVSSLPGPRGDIKCRFSGGGQLVEAQSGGNTWHYDYDALGRRVGKRSNNESWEFFWAGQQLVGEEVQKLGAEPMRREYLYFPGSVTPIAFREGGRVYWMQSDVRGAVIRVFDDAGREVWRATYDSFGTAQIGLEEVRQPWRLAGQYEDTESGLFYNFARYYSPLTRSYLSRDPNWYKPEASNYGYALNDPWNRADPNGALAPLIVAGLLGVGAIAVSAVVGGVIAGVTGGDPIAGAIDGAVSMTGSLVGAAVGFAVGGPPGAAAGFVVGGGVGAFGGELAQQAYRGDELCLSCAFAVGAISMVLDRLLLGASKIPGLRNFVRKVGGEALDAAAAAIRRFIPRKLPAAVFPTNESQVRHIFRDSVGHLPDTAASRELLQDVTTDRGAQLGTDRFGNTWFHRIREDGTQVWVQVRDGVIQNGGVNQTPRPFNPQSGLSGGGRQ